MRCQLYPKPYPTIARRIFWYVGPLSQGKQVLKWKLPPVGWCPCFIRLRPNSYCILLVAVVAVEKNPGTASCLCMAWQRWRQKPKQEKLTNSSPLCRNSPPHQPRGLIEVSIGVLNHDRPRIAHKKLQELESQASEWMKPKKQKESKYVAQKKSSVVLHAKKKEIRDSYLDSSSSPNKCVPRYCCCFYLARPGSRCYHSIWRTRAGCHAFYSRRFLSGFSHSLALVETLWFLVFPRPERSSIYTYWASQARMYFEYQREFAELRPTVDLSMNPFFIFIIYSPRS